MEEFCGAATVLFPVVEGFSHEWQCLVPKVQVYEVRMRMPISNSIYLTPYRASYLRIRYVVGL